METRIDVDCIQVKVKVNGMKKILLKTKIAMFLIGLARLISPIDIFLVNNNFLKSKRLTNQDIKTHYQNEEFYFMRSDFLGAFAYWVTVQSPYDIPNLKKPLRAFGRYVAKTIKADEVKKFTYQELKEFINEGVFESIPEIEKLNHPKIDSGKNILFVDRYTVINPDHDFIDLGALAKNIFYMLLREEITQA